MLLSTRLKLLRSKFEDKTGKLYENEDTKHKRRCGQPQRHKRHNRLCVFVSLWLGQQHFQNAALGCTRKRTPGLGQRHHF